MEEIATLPGVEQVCPVPVYETCQTELSPMTITTGDMVGSYGTLGERVHRRRDAHCGH